MPVTSQSVTLSLSVTVACVSRHHSDIRAKANQQLAFVRRNIRTRSSSTKEKLFHTLVRPHLEYAATVWDPRISKQKHSLEMIQRRAARWVTNRHHNTSSVTDMLHTLGWTSLEHRRATSRLCMLFQIYHGSIGIPHDPYILPCRHTPRPSRQTDMHTLATYQRRTNYFKCSFFPQTIVAWNALTKSVVTSSTLDAFKAALPLGSDTMLAFLNTPTFPVFIPPTYFNPAFILRFYLSFIFYLAFIYCASFY